MKTRNLKWLAIPMLLITVSCGSDFLELEPVSEANANIFFRNQDDIIAAVNSVYDELQGAAQYGSNFIAIIETRSDNVENNNPGAGGGIAYSIDRFTDDPTNTILRETWASLYQGIFKANTVLDNIDKITMDEAAKNRVKGEATFLRALSYFNLVRLWGDVPLIINAKLPEVIRSTAKRDATAEVYVQIEQDLSYASANLPATYATADRGRATSGAAKALLAKVYLTQQKLALAETTLRSITGPYALLDSIGKVYMVNNELNTEIMFAIRYVDNVTGEDHGAWYAYTGAPIILPGLLNAYKPGDERKLQAQGYIQYATTYVPGKFRDDDTDGRFGNDFPVIRYSDVLLMLAETLNRIQYVADGEAFNLLNQVRARANATLYTSTDLPNQNAFNDAILLERRLEFALEHERWFDLVRFGKAIEVMAATGITVAPHRLVFPIPQSEIDAFNDQARFPQNPNY